MHCVIGSCYTEENRKQWSFLCDGGTNSYTTWKCWGERFHFNVTIDQLLYQERVELEIDHIAKSLFPDDSHNINNLNAQAEIRDEETGLG